MNGRKINTAPMSRRGAIVRKKPHIKPVIYKTFPLAQASEAHKLMESSQHIGKIVLTL